MGQVKAIGDVARQAIVTKHDGSGADSVPMSCLLALGENDDTVNERKPVLRHRLEVINLFEEQIALSVECSHFVHDRSPPNTNSEAMWLDRGAAHDFAIVSVAASRNAGLEHQNPGQKEEFRGFRRFVEHAW
jgi:hypothetical protein